MKNAHKIIGVILILAGTAALAYGKFSYTKETHDIDLGLIQMEIEDRETVYVPDWVGIGAIVAGSALLLVGGKRLWSGAS